MEWRTRFEKLQGGKEIVSLTGETSADLRLLEKGDVIVCTPTQVGQIFPLYFRFFSHLLVVGRPFTTVVATTQKQNIGLLLSDEVPLVDGEVGSTYRSYEVVISRTRYVLAQIEIWAGGWASGWVHFSRYL
jgi:pre-mRNA-splicing helicase BRR2